MASTLTTFDALLKQHYTDTRVEDMSMRDNPLFAMLKKYEKFNGRNLPIPVIWGNPQGVSATFSQAQTGAAATYTRTDTFNLTRVKLYSVVQIDNEQILASEGNEGAFVSAKVTEIDGAINAYSRILATGLYRKGWGSVGRVGQSGFATTTVTLGNGSTDLDPAQAANFEVGQQIVFSATEDANLLRTGVIFVTVTGVDYDAGTLTIDQNLSGVTGIADGDFIFIRGNRQDSATPTRLMPAGLEDWAPSTAPGATAFFGVARNTNVQRLAGLRYDGSSATIEEALMTGSQRLIKAGGSPDYCFVNHENFDRLEKSLMARVRYVDVEVKPGLGFRGIQIRGSKGDINVIPDVNCPAKRAFMLTMNTWKLYSLGKACRPLDTDGLTMLRQSSSDGVEVRYGGYLNLGCNAPGWNGNVQLAT
jgi:hypothetical protein